MTKLIRTNLTVWLTLIFLTAFPQEGEVSPACWFRADSIRQGDTVWRDMSNHGLHAIPQSGLMPGRGTDYRGQVSGSRGQVADVEPHGRASLQTAQTAHTVDSTPFLPAALVSQTAPDPYFAPAPLPLLPADMMKEVSPAQLPPLEAGMVNVTGQVAGYRVETHGRASLQTPNGFALAVPYDPLLLPQGFTADDIQTYVYDKRYHRWVAIQRDSVNTKELLVCSRFRPWEKGLLGSQEDLGNPQDAQARGMVSMGARGDGGGESPLDFINAVLKTPEMPETSAYTPTSIKELKAADPLEGLTLVQPPAANNSGTANMSYPIELPAGRQGMQPNLALTYSSGGGNGWLGVGWDLSVPSITVETRWGVPRYDSQKESEVYVYEGEQLVTKDGNGDFRKLPHRTNHWTDRHELDQDGREQFWPRKNEAFDSIVRHGNGPGNYWWSVTHKNGVTDYYGKYASDSGVDSNCVLRTGDNNSSGAIAHWALAESVDPLGNSVRYYYDVELAYGGKQIYIDSISYTCFTNDSLQETGFYSVEFGRDNGREDVIISCNRGFKEVTASKLCQIVIKSRDAIIRGYGFYTQNDGILSNYKTRLKSFFTIEDDAAEEILMAYQCGKGVYEFHNHIHYDFDYYEAPTLLFGDEEDIILDDDQIETPLGGLLGNTEEKASALGATKGVSWSAGGTASVGLGPVVCLTSLSVGGNFDYSRSESEGVLTMIDLDGDGLADKVFKEGNDVYYRKQVKTEEYVFSFEEPVKIEGVSGFLKENSSTTTWGLQASAGCAYSGSWPTTRSTTSTYFADVNGDGLPDLVTEGGVLFNITPKGGSVCFKSYYTMYEENQQMGMEHPETVTVSSTSGCGGIIFDGEVNDSVVCRYDLQLDTMFDFKGEYQEDSLVRAYVDSMEATGQYECHLERLYGSSVVSVYRKTLRCSPELLDPDIDAVKVWVAQKDGRINIRSLFILDIDTASAEFKQSHYANGVRYTIQHERHVERIGSSFDLISSRSNELYSQIVPRESARIPYRSDIEVRVAAGDLIFFRLQSQGDRSFDYVNWKQEIVYLDGTGELDIHGMNSDRYSSTEDFVVSGEKYFSAYQYGVVDIDIDINTTDVGNNGWLHINSSSPWNITNANYPSSGHFTDIIPIVDSMNVSLNLSSVVFEKDTIAFVLEAPFSKWGNIEIRPHIRYRYLDTLSFPTPRMDTLDYYPPVAFFSMFEYLIGMFPIGPINPELMEAYHRYFGPLYRGWGQFSYNNSTEEHAPMWQHIDIRTFHLTNYENIDTAAINTNISQEDVNLHNSADEMADYYTSNKMYNPLRNTRWVEMEPDSRHWIWKGYGGINYIGRQMMSDTRHPAFADVDTLTIGIPEYDYPIPVVTVGSPMTVRKQNESKLRNHSLSLAVPVVSVGQSISNGNNTILTEYMDLNGDRYPDVIGNATVQYTTPWGGLGETRKNGGATISNTYSKGQTFGASYSIPKRSTSNNPKSSKISFDGAGNVGASHGGGNDETAGTFIDMNGDGLPDKVSSLGKVQLNTGYAFLPAEEWHYEDIRVGNSQNMGLSVGANFNVGQASIGGGLGINQSENITEEMLIDLNGDGLPDKVYTSYNGIKISYNLGNGQWSAIHNCDQISQLSYSSSFSKSINASVTLGFTFFGFLKVCAGVSTSPYSSSFSKDKMQLTDINGDGYVDYVTSVSESLMTVRYNLMGKTNLLRKVTNFTGSTVELDYEMPLPTFDKPQRSWNLAEVRTFNGDTTNAVGGNRTLTRFAYANPNYSRYERMDYGYDSVVTKQYNTDVSDSTLYRYTVEEFENKVFNKRGRKTRQCIYDAEGHPYIETIYDATLADMNHPDSVYGGDCPAYVFVKEEAEIRNHYEGGNTPGLTTVILRSYDNKRNIIAYTYLGDTTRTDDYFKAEIEYATGMGHNLISLPTQIEVRNTNNNLLQKRTASYGTKGQLENLTQCNTTDNAEYEFVHDMYGNLTHSILPANQNSERLEFSYIYDSIIHTYPVRVENNSLGYYSSANYDYRFGKPTKTVDINGNEMRYEYDRMGRMVKITAPNELADSLPYTVRMSYSPHVTNSYSSNNLYSYARTDHYDRHHSDDVISTVLICDGWGRLLQTKKDAEISGQERSLVTGKLVYDCFGRTIAQYHPFTEDTASYPSYNPYYEPLTLTKTQYDILDRQTKIKLPTGDSTLMAYGLETLSYDGRNCLRTAVTDPKGNTVTTFTEGRGLRIAIVAPYNTTTSFVYDPLGQMLSSEDPNGFMTGYSYDMLGRMVQRIHPDAGTDTYIYDPAGNMTTHTNGKGDVTQYNYHYNQLTDITYPAYPANHVHYEYGTLSHAGINAVGKVIMQEDASGWQKFEYGKLGEVTKNMRTFALPFENEPYTFAMEYGYDSYNRIQRMTYPDGEVVSYNYDRGGMLQRVTGQKNGQAYSYIDSIFYNKFELKERVLYGNGAESRYEYDVLLRLDSLSTRDGTSSRQQMQGVRYAYDAVGNITGITNSVSSVNNLGGLYHVQYSYDHLHRMTSATGWHTDESRIYKVRMSYDLNGRIQYKYVGRLGSCCRECICVQNNAYTYASGNRVSRIEPLPIPVSRDTESYPYPSVQINYDYNFQWDGSGNMIRQTDNIHNKVRQLSWDGENRLEGVRDYDNLSLYQYDASGERTYKLTGMGYTQSINGIQTRRYTLDHATLYASPYLVVTPQGYTKHYYAESERIASRIGNGGLTCVDTPIVSQSECSGKMQANSDYFDTIAQNRLNTPIYTTAHLFDTLYYWKTSHGNTEPDCYWYHPDHLGSASWITQSDGGTVQYLYYLPWGEDHINQRRSGYTGSRYTFSAKEKDAETGYSYFGSRYYSSDLSIWLSVDPMSGKYPYQSNYIYCGNNPIRVIDPNGEDEWEVDKKGNITWKCESEKHQLFAIDKKGKRTGEFITLKNKNILTQLTKEKRIVLKGFDGNVCEEGNRREAVVGKKDVDDLLKVFKFVADNSDVEWEFEYSKEDGKNQYSLVTDGFSGQVTSHFGSKAITSIHSHPKEPNNYQSELNSMYGDRGYLNSYPQTNMYVYMPKSTRLFNVNKNAYIRHINNDYRRFINLGR